MPDPQNLYQELKNALDEFKQFLDEHANDIKPAIGPLNQLLNNQVFQLIDQLVALLTRLKTEINNLNVGNVPGLTEIPQFTNSIKTLLETSKNLLPNEAAAIDEVLRVVNVVGGLPSIDTVKADITSAIDAIINHLNDLKA